MLRLMPIEYCRNNKTKENSVAVLYRFLVFQIRYSDYFYLYYIE